LDAVSAGLLTDYKRRVHGDPGQRLYHPGARRRVQLRQGPLLATQYGPRPTGGKVAESHVL
jgi:hypothetical protein